MASLAAPKEDGRVTRKRENRARILDGLFVLICNGKPHPTLKEVAAQAGVTPRTILNHFPDLSSLVLAAAAYGREQAPRNLPAIPDAPDAEQCLREFFKRCGEFFDRYAAVRWALLTTARELPGVDRRHHKRGVHDQLEARIEELLGRYGMSLSGDRELRAALLVVLDPLAWRVLRMQQGLSRADAAGAMARSVMALLRDAAARPATRRGRTA